MVKSIIARIDGASRGNPGPAGIGVIIQNKEGEILKKISEYIGDNKTNNQAEYHSLVKALEIGSELSADQIKVFSDSQLLVRQMNGEYNINSKNLKNLYRKAKELESKFRKTSFRHISREKNSEADELANKAIDSKNN